MTDYEFLTIGVGDELEYHSPGGVHMILYVEKQIHQDEFMSRVSLVCPDNHGCNLYVGREWRITKVFCDWYSIWKRADAPIRMDATFADVGEQDHKMGLDPEPHFDFNAGRSVL